MELSINAEKFFQRLERLQSEWLNQKQSLWGGADAVCIPFGVANEEIAYSKSSSFHIYMFGFEEFSDSLILLTKNNFYFMSSLKKCSFLQKQVGDKHGDITLHYLERSKDDGVTRENFNKLMNAVRKGGGKKLGSLFKDKFEGKFISTWMDVVEQSQIEKVEIAPALGYFFAVKDESEIENCRRAAVLTNKVMKHGFVQEMENILDSDSKISHRELSEKVKAIILDPSKIGIKLAADAVESCYEPIIQSGGDYDIKLSAVSNENNLTANVILCSLGARYKSYCASIARTFLVDAPKKVEKMYATLISLHDVCLEHMTRGRELKDVYEGARNFLKNKDATLLSYLPKTFGFAIGIEFRDNTLVLNQSNDSKFKTGMVFNLSVGFHNIPLTEDDTSNTPEAVKKLLTFSLLLSDIVIIQEEGVPDVLTKFSKEYSDISYNIGDQEGEEDEEKEDLGNQFVDGVRRSTRSREEKEANEVAASNRMEKQQELMKKKLEEARKRMRNAGFNSGSNEVAVEMEAKDLVTYKSPDELPKDLIPNRVKVDFDKESILVPLNGVHVPFHVSTIKSITQPDPDMRINFYIPGAALGKEVAKNMQYLVAKYGEKYTFIKELTFRSTDGKNLSTVYQQFQELRKRVKQREQKVEQEKDLVIQSKLIRIKDQRVPRLQEVTLRPQLSGKKCVGTLEAHQNGLRFTSSKAEVLDVMYANIKHAIFQPCDRTTMVLVHFHLKDFILVGKKKQKDVQFYTEVIESSLNLEGSRRSAYDPDEIDDEQREREMRRRLNMAFKEFCSKVEKVAAHYDFNLQMDVPFKKSGFEGNWSKEMVLLQPTTHCLVNLTEWPPLVITLSDVEHAHFERVTYATKNFDLTFIFKNWDIAPRTITAIDTKYMDIVQDWLNLVEITCTKGPRTINWTDVMKIVRETRDIFYDDKDEDGEAKPAGWLFLSADASDDEEDEEDDEDSSFGSEQYSDDDEDDSDNDDDDDDDDDFEEDESEDDYDEEDELEEKGQSWEELERDAKAADRAKRSFEEEDDPAARKKQKKR